MEYVWYILRLWLFLGGIAFIFSFGIWCLGFIGMILYCIFQNPIKVWKEYRSQNEKGIYKLFKDILKIILRYPYWVLMLFFQIYFWFYLSVMMFYYDCKIFGFEHWYNYFYEFLQFLGIRP